MGKTAKNVAASKKEQLRIRIVQLIAKIDCQHIGDYFRLGQLLCLYFGISHLDDEGIPCLCRDLASGQYPELIGKRACSPCHYDRVLRFALLVSPDLARRLHIANVRWRKVFTAVSRRHLPRRSVELLEILASNPNTTLSQVSVTGEGSIRIPKTVESCCRRLRRDCLRTCAIAHGLVSRIDARRGDRQFLNTELARMTEVQQVALQLAEELRQLNRVLKPRIYVLAEAG